MVFLSSHCWPGCFPITDDLCASGRFNPPRSITIRLFPRSNALWGCPFIKRGFTYSDYRFAIGLQPIGRWEGDKGSTAAMWTNACKWLTELWRTNICWSSVWSRSADQRSPNWAVRCVSISPNFGTLGRSLVHTKSSGTLSPKSPIPKPTIII